MSIHDEIRPPVEYHPIDAWSVNAATVLGTAVGATLAFDHGYPWVAAILLAVHLLTLPAMARRLHEGDKALRRWR